MTTATPEALTFTRTDTELDEFFVRNQEISDLGNLLGILGWDQQVKMPPQANQVRGPQLATMQALLHARQTDPRIGALLDTLEQRVQGPGYSDADRGDRKRRRVGKEC